MNELIIDNFAGGGGASTGIELATGRDVDIAINHDIDAILMHKTNHPHTKHYCENVWEVDPIEATQGNSVALCWFSPDCKHFSKAKGGKPVEKNIRGLAWVAIKWAKMIKPRVIMLENVEEFKTWGPLLENNTPDPKRKGETFHQFIKALKKYGYKVEHRELRACDYGAPTTRKRFFLIARCDGKQIVWPEPTHGEGLEVQAGLLKPYRTAGEIIDWGIPIKSIFDRRIPLKENSLIRIYRGIKKFIIDETEPFIVEDGAYFLSHYYTHQGKEVRGSSLKEPIATIPTANRFGLVKASLVDDLRLNSKSEKVYSFLTKYYGSDVGQSLKEPLHTITTKDRFGLVTVKGKDYRISDIGMRMLQPRELFRAQGFPDNYIIDKDYTGKTYPKTNQVARCGNAVPPPLAKALVKANLPEICQRVKEVI